MDLPGGDWRISGGPSDVTTRDRLQRQFRALAERAAMAADLGKKPLFAWLDRLKEGPFFEPTATSGGDGKGWVLEGGWINHLCIASAEACVEFETVACAAGKKLGAEARHDNGKLRNGRKRLAANLDRLRKECGWSYDELADQTGIDKKLILQHVNRGSRPRPKTLRTYADAFTRALERTVTVEELEK